MADKIERELGIVLRAKGAPEAKQAIREVAEEARQANSAGAGGFGRPPDSPAGPSARLDEDLAAIGQLAAREQELGDQKMREFEQWKNAQLDHIEALARKQERLAQQEADRLTSLKAKGGAIAGGLALAAGAAGELYERIERLSQIGNGSEFDGLVNVVQKVTGFFRELRSDPFGTLFNTLSFGTLKEVDREIDAAEKAHKRATAAAAHEVETRLEALANRRQTQWDNFVNGLTEDLKKLRAINEELERREELARRAERGEIEGASAHARADAPGTGPVSNVSTEAALDARRLAADLADTRADITTAKRAAADLAEALDLAQTKLREAQNIAAYRQNDFERGPSLDAALTDPVQATERRRLEKEFQAAVDQSVTAQAERDALAKQLAQAEERVSQVEEEARIEQRKLIDNFAAGIKENLADLGGAHTELATDVKAAADNLIASTAASGQEVSDTLRAGREQLEKILTDLKPDAAQGREIAEAIALVRNSTEARDQQILASLDEAQKQANAGANLYQSMLANQQATTLRLSNLEAAIKQSQSQ